MAKNKLIVLDNPDLQQIEESKALQIKKTFEPMVKMLEGFEKQCAQVFQQAEKVGIDEDLTVIAKRIRLDIAQVRIQTDKIRKEQKEEYLRAGKAIDGASNILKWAVVDKEKRLKEIEDHFETQERNRKIKLQKERADELSKYVEDISHRDLTGMEQDVWEAYLSTKKKDHEDRIEAERIANEERLKKEEEDRLERERIEKENKRLKEEAEQAELKLEKERKERERIEAERQAKLDKEKKETEAKLEKERKENEKKLAEAKAKHDKELEKQRLEKQEAERKLKEAQQKAKEQEERKQKLIQDELNKGDADKVKDLISDLKALKTKYVFKSKKNKKKYADTGTLIDKVVKHIET